DKIAVVGVNGSGKSTFAKILAGNEPFQSGERKIGYNVILSYFGQHQAEELDLSKEAIQIIDDIAIGEIRTRQRTILGSFLFHGDDVFKKVSVLSGGEKSRLALAIMLLQPVNFLIMDEPTNHLDMRSKKVLQDALTEYEGTYIIVSHDRAFLDPIINKVIEFSLGNARTYLGNVSDYLAKKKEERESITQESQRVESSTEIANPCLSGRQAKSEIRPQASQLSEKDRKRLEAEKRNKLHKLLLPHKQKLDEIEKEISRIESRKNVIQILMANPDFYKDGEKAKDTSHEYKELLSRLDEMYYSWNEVTHTIEDIQSKEK
ncbi:MAG: ABC-F family ATP-binding cassette domain-containing protein, partial [Ignavibacteriales bacterium]|nr:ABC-F family ATP-binding cassette domain-containing protein [Ignavibacteriales bacterium]